VDGARYYEKSDAVLRIVGNLGGLWPLLRLFLWVPKSIRDGCYSAFARRRYRFFGKRETCPVPDPRIRDRFIS
jgi:predicted DCC family thiol-disulfide oxidoreductase YuxK